MARSPDSAASDLDDRSFDASALARTASWGIGAASALFLAVLAGLSESGAPRIAVAVSALSGTGKSEKTAATPTANTIPAKITQQQTQLPQEFMTEARRLKEELRVLAVDRDRLIQRVSTLERNLEDVTGSIRRQEESVQSAPQAQTPALPVPTAAIAAPPWPPMPVDPATTAGDQPPARTAAPEVTAAALPAAPALPLPPARPQVTATAETEQPADTPAEPPALPRQAAAPQKQEPRPARTAYGVDLGGAISLDRLRMLWHTLRSSEPELLQGLRPVTHVREIRRGGRPDVRLIAGPLASAEQAARLCAAILNAGRYCEPAVFRGYHLR